MAKIENAPCPCGSAFTRIQWLTERTDNYMIISGIRVSQAQVRDNLKAALNLPSISCTMERTCQAGTDMLLISLIMNNTLFSDEIKNLQQVIAWAEETLTEQNGIKIKIRLVQQRV